MIKYIYLISILCIISPSNIPLLDDEIGQAIFYDNKQYLIYVNTIPNQPFLIEFTQFCATGQLCAILDSQNQAFERVTTFVGFTTNSYLLILDIQNRRKYCLGVGQETKTQQIANFYEQFKNGQLQPYYTSEPIPEIQTEQYFTKVVGLTFESFLNQPGKVRALYLYTENELCSNCLDVYKALQKSAKRFIGQDIEYGFLDLFKNQHKLLIEQDVPLVLLYKKNSKEYTKLDSQNLDKLQPTISTLLQQSTDEL